MTVSEFTAVATCPWCGNIAVHWMEDPPASKTAGNTVGVWEAYDRLIGLNTYASGGFVNDKSGWDTTNCRVLRQCRKCGRHWGEK